MKMLLLVAILAFVAALATVVVVALYAHKKAGTGPIKLVGEVGYVDSELTPIGTVLVSGELWRARSKNGVPLSPRSKVRVVDFVDQLAVVEPWE